MDTLSSQDLINLYKQIGHHIYYDTKEHYKKDEITQNFFNELIYVYYKYYFLQDKSHYYIYNNNINKSHNFKKNKNNKKKLQNKIYNNKSSINFTQNYQKQKIQQINEKNHQNLSYYKKNINNYNNQILNFNNSASNNNNIDHKLIPRKQALHNNEKQLYVNSSTSNFNVNNSYSYNNNSLQRYIDKENVKLNTANIVNNHSKSLDVNKTYKIQKFNNRSHNTFLQKNNYISNYFNSNNKNNKKNINSQIDNNYFYTNNTLTQSSHKLNSSSFNNNSLQQKKKNNKTTNSLFYSCFNHNMSGTFDYNKQAVIGSVVNQSWYQIFNNIQQSLDTIGCKNFGTTLILQFTSEIELNNFLSTYSHSDQLFCAYRIARRPTHSFKIKNINNQNKIQFEQQFYQEIINFGIIPHQMYWEYNFNTSTVNIGFDQSMFSYSYCNNFISNIAGSYTVENWSSLTKSQREQYMYILVKDSDKVDYAKDSLNQFFNKYYDFKTEKITTKIGPLFKISFIEENQQIREQMLKKGFPYFKGFKKIYSLINQNSNQTNNNNSTNDQKNNNLNNEITQLRNELKSIRNMVDTNSHRIETIETRLEKKQDEIKNMFEKLINKDERPVSPTIQ